MKLLVQILLRRAREENQANPRQWLLDLQATKWSSVNTQNGQIVGTSVNGKSVQLLALPGTNIGDLLGASELALQCLEAGTGPTNTSRGILR